MPVMVLYKDKRVPTAATEAIMQELGQVTEEALGAKIEVRVLETLQSYNANEVHIEMRFRDFMEWTDGELQKYHDKVMIAIGKALKEQDVQCAYSFYIVPSMPPRSIWAQGKS